MLLTFILIFISFPSPTHSFSPGSKPCFSANPSHCSLLFLLQDWLHGFPRLFTITSTNIRFLLFSFSVGSVRQIKLTHVGFQAHAEIASRIVYRTAFVFITQCTANISCSWFSAHKSCKNLPLKGTKQFLMLTENEHVPAVDVDGWWLLPWPSDRTAGVVLLNANKVKQCVTNTHPFNGLLSGTTRVSRYQKGKPVWILLKQETVSVSGISWAIGKTAPCSRQTTTPAPHHSVFPGRMPFLLPNQQRQSTGGKQRYI